MGTCWALCLHFWGRGSDYFFITLGGILDLRTFPRPGSSEALSIGPGAAARDSRAAAIDRRRDLLDMSNLAGPPYTRVRSAQDLAEAVLRIEPPSVVAVDTEGDGITLLMQVAAADKRCGIHTLMAWADDVEAYNALRELVRGCHRVYVWAARSDDMAGLGYGDVRNAKLVDLQAHYAPDLVRRAWATSGLPDWALPEPRANAGIALDRTWAATIGVAMGTVAAKGAIPAPTRKATTANSGWIATRNWTRMPEPRSALHGTLHHVQAGASPTDMLLYAASDAAATLALGFLMETLRLEPTLTYIPKGRLASRSA